MHSLQKVQGAAALSGAGGQLNKQDAQFMDLLPNRALWPDHIWKKLGLPVPSEGRAPQATRDKWEKKANDYLAARKISGHKPPLHPSPLQPVLGGVGEQANVQQSGLGEPRNPRLPGAQENPDSPLGLL